MMWWDDGGWGVGQWLAMTLMMVAFWGLLIVLVVWLVRGMRADSNRGNTSLDGRRADEALAERFARGEIDEEEFTRRRQVLHSVAAGSQPTTGA